MQEITATLIRQAAAGNQEAITQLYEWTYSGIYKAVHAMVRDEDSVLDIVQDSYIKGFQNLNQLDKPENYRAWMKRIAINKAKDYLKKKKPILFSEMANDDGEELDFRDEHLDHCPDEIMDKQETTRLMNEILDTLGEDQRLVIGMFYYEQLSVREIAEILGCSENTVKSRLNYGRKKVQAKVLELEKKGTKLYSLAPLPFLLWLFYLDAQAAEIPSAAVLQSITAACAVAGSTAGGGVAGRAVSSTSAKTTATAGVKVAAGTSAKALTTKIIAGVLALTIIGGGAVAVASHLGNKEEARTSQEVSDTEQIQEDSIPETVEAAPNQVSAEEAYRSVIENYQTVLSTDSTAYLAAPENYFNGDHQAIFYYHTYQDSDFYYAYRDMDGNGMEELLIGAGSGGYIQMVDLYGFDGTQPVQLIDESTLGDRSTLTILEDNTISLFGSSGAAESSQDYWQLDGCSLIPVEPSSAAEAGDIDWYYLEVTKSSSESSVEEESAAVSFDTILSDIQYVVENIPTEEYQNNQDYYDSLYPHLGDGVLWSLTYGPIAGYDQAFWKTYYDVDNDGQDELCIGRGVSLGRPITLLAIYKQNAEIMVGDQLNNYSLPEGLDEEGMPLAGWEYLCG